MGAAPRKLEWLLFALDAGTRYIAVSTLLHCRANRICCAVRNQQHVSSTLGQRQQQRQQAPKTAADAAAEAADSVDSAASVRENAL